MIWKDFLVVGTGIAGASLIAIPIFGIVDCGYPNWPHALGGAVIGSALMALGVLVGVGAWAWRRIRARD